MSISSIIKCSCLGKSQRNVSKDENDAQLCWWIKGSYVDTNNKRKETNRVKYLKTSS